MPNFFEQFQDADDDRTFLKEAPRPGLAERFFLNMEAATRTGTAVGALRDAGRPDDRHQFDARFEAFPEYDGFQEGAAALFGQIAGTIVDHETNLPHLENMLPINAGKRIVHGAGYGLTKLRARLFAGAVDSALVNAVTDAGIQGVENAAGFRDGFDPLQFGASVGLGTVAGGALAPISHRPTDIDRFIDSLGGDPDPIVRPDFDDAIRQDVTGTPLDPQIKAQETQRRLSSTNGAENANDSVSPSQGDLNAIPENAPDALPDGDEVVALGDRLFPDPAPARVANITDDGANTNRGASGDSGAVPAWRGDADVIDEGAFGPVIDVDQHDRDWGRIVERLRGLETGEAPKALRHDAIGEIDVIWGEYDPVTQKGFGLSKIVGKHPEALDDLPEILAKSEVYSQSENRIWFRHGQRRTVISLKYMQDDKLWLLTSYDDTPGRRKGQRVKGTMGRDDGFQADTSSASPADKSIQPDGDEGKNARHAKDRTEGPDSGQTGAQSSSASPEINNLTAETPDGQRVAPDTQALTELDAAVKALDAEADALIQNRIGKRGSLRGERSRPEGGIARNRTNVSSPVEASNKALGRVSDLANQLVKLVNVASVRQGRFTAPGGRTKGILGQHNRKTGSIRIRHQDDFVVLAHEVGHHMDVKLGKDLSYLIERFRAEVGPLAYEGTPEGQELSEGFAEFFRFYLTNRSHAEREAPKFTKAFSELLNTQEPDWARGLDDLRDAWSAWLERPSVESVESGIVSSRRLGPIEKLTDDMKRLGLGNTISEWISDFYSKFLDDLHPINVAQRSLLRLMHDQTGHPINQSIFDDAYKLARMARGSQQAGKMDIDFGVHEYRRLEPRSASLRDAVILAIGGKNALSRRNDPMLRRFDSYLWSRRALGEWERYQQGLIPNPPDKFTKGDHVQTVAELEVQFPDFKKAATMIYDWQQALWRKKLDAGLISLDQYRQGLEIKDYVPGLRAFDYDGDPTGKAGRAGSGKSGFVRRFQGSTRDVISPLESMMADAYETASAIARNDVFKALDRLALEAGHGGSAIAERIPVSELKAQMVDPLEAVEAAARQQGYSKADFSVVRDGLEAVLGDEKATLYRPALISDKGEHIVFFRDAGELQALRLADDKFGDELFNALTNMSRSESHVLINLFAAPAQVLRTGITAAPEFIAANLIRDQVMSWIFYGEPFKRLAATTRGFVDEIAGRDAARQYNTLGGIMGGAAASGVRDGAVNRDLRSLQHKGWLAQRLAPKPPRQMLKGIFEITELSETATRIGLMRTFKEAAEKRGLDELEAAFEAVYRARDHIDFDRHGAKMTGVNRLTPFLNASLQGFDKSYRVLLQPLAKKWRGDILTLEDQRSLGEAQKAWARLAILTVAGMSLHALMSRHEDYDDLSETTRATHWMVKSGETWTAIPKPFELAVMLNVGEAVWDGAVKSDPTAFERWLSGATSVLSPPNILEGNPLVKSYYEWIANEDFFTGSAIIPEHMRGLEPHLQAKAYTSQLAKDIGYAFHWSPALAEKMFVNFTGGLGRSTLSLYDAALSDKPGQSLDDMAVLRRFIKSASKGNRSSRRFWDLVSPSLGSYEGAAQSYKVMRTGGREAAAADYLANLAPDRRAYVAASSLTADIRRLHPLDRARQAVRALGGLRKDLADGSSVDGLTRRHLGIVDDILSEMSMVEARNVLILTGEPGWQHRDLTDISTYMDELEAINPHMAELVADKYATAKVLPFETVQEVWPDLRERLLTEGSDTFVGDLAVHDKAGYEFGGQAIPRKKRPDVPGSDDPEAGLN